MEWWVFPALVLCAVTFTAAAGVLVFWAGRGVWRLLAAWRRSPRHAWRDPQEATPEEIRAAGEAVGRGYRAAWVLWDTDPRFGSMQLDADRGYQERVSWAIDAWQPPTVPPRDWRAQTAADLAPAALDSGPGGPSLAPGPDQVVPLEVIEWPSWADIPVDKNGPDIEFPQVGSARPLDIEPEPGPVHTVAGRLVETSDEWLRRLVADAAPGWTYAGTVAA